MPLSHLKVECCSRACSPLAHLSIKSVGVGGGHRARLCPNVTKCPSQHLWSSLINRPGAVCLISASWWWYVAPSQAVKPQPWVFTLQLGFFISVLQLLRSYYLIHMWWAGISGPRCLPASNIICVKAARLTSLQTSSCYRNVEPDALYHLCD